MKTIDIQIMAQHYLIAALWADCPEGTAPRTTQQAKNKALATCKKFASLIEAELWLVILKCPAYWAHPDCVGTPEAAIGHITTIPTRANMRM